MMKDICKDFQSICLFVLCLFFTACIPENIELPVASAPAEAIDLGLSVKWASYNVGANSPEEYGGYFAWGETKIKSNYAESTSLTYGLSESELKSLGIIGSDGNLTAAYDAATVNWGSAWRMPTLDEVKELLDKCSWQWTTVNGIYGQKVTGPNGNSIFLPAAGRRNGTEVGCYRGSSGYYWSGTQDESYSVSAYVLYFYRDNLIHIDGLEGNDFYYRNRGFSVRPVTEYTNAAISVTTGTATDITASGVTLLGSIANATQSLTCGVIYGTSSALSSTSGTMKSTTSDGDFSLGLTGLNANTTYYYRAYVVVDGEYRYGEICSFKTEQNGGSVVAEAVDLGLSVKWACCNVGADVPEGYGGYYAWGETEEKSDYDWDTYQYIDTDGDWQDRWPNIGSNISGTSYDVAHVKWGDGWRMPTLAEIQELCEKCSWESTSVNGVWGQKVTGPNGNSIFLPAAGYRDGTEVGGRGSYGYYWSGTLSEVHSGGAYYLYFFSGRGYWGGCHDRRYGHTVRPVTDK